MTTLRLLAARMFAHDAHDSIGQTRKYSKEPYWVHTDEVAQILAQYGYSEDMQIAGHLHDIPEDVSKTFSYYDLGTIRNLFGDHVASMVDDLTSVFTHEAFPELNRKTRKQCEIRRIERIRSESKCIKLADILSNTKTIVKNDPDFAKVYIAEKAALMPVLDVGAYGRPLWEKTAAQINIALDKLKLIP